MSDFSAKRVWLITGCSSGFGRDLTEAVLANKERVVATLRKPEVLNPLTQKYSKEQLLILPLDVRNQKQIEETFESIQNVFGRLDVVVNNAGYGLLGEVEGTDDKPARELFDVLFWGAVDISRRAVAFFREVNPVGVGGRILQVSSIGGFVGFPGKAFYHAGKFALEGFSEALQGELPPEWNIKITIIEPGGFRTEWAKSSLAVIPQHPAYKDPSTPTSKVRAFMSGPNVSKGDPAKAAQAMIRISSMESPPKRIALGVDALDLLKAECKSVLEEADKYEDISRSCLAEDANAEIDSINKVYRSSGRE